MPATTIQAPQRIFLTPPQLARRWGCATDKVYHFIRTGELRASNLATRLGGKMARWRIALVDIELFEAARSNKPQPPRPDPRRKKDTHYDRFDYS
jgi:hypothetical protein